jgi:hypothetical protein
MTTTLPPSTVLSDSAEEVQATITGVLLNPVNFYSCLVAALVLFGLLFKRYKTVRHLTLPIVVLAVAMDGMMGRRLLSESNGVRVTGYGLRVARVRVD